jgi:hypothetical protein
MRLLAYGGTSLVERCRFGQWPQVPAGALGDKYSLVGAELSYGVGLLQDKDPFLILRQRQNLDNRGGYAFTLFLDPGSEVWKAFEWNGASLALAFLHDALGEKLLARPEDCTEREISERLRDLQPPAPSMGSKRTDLEELWVGVILTNKAKDIAASNAGGVDPYRRVIVSPHDAGFERRPSIETVAASLAALQPCFRCGDGWLVGGSKEHGEAFGARLVFDDGAPDNPEISQLMQRGRKVIVSWKTASTHPVFISAQPSFIQMAARKSAQPLFLWETPKHDSPVEFLEGIIDLADRLEDPKAIRKGSSYRGKQLEEAIQQASRIAALAGTHPLDEFDTFLVLGHHFDLNLKLAAKDVRRLQPKALIKELVRRKKRPTESDSRMRLSAEIRLEVWRNLIEVDETSDGIPSLLKEAVNDLLEDSLGGLANRQVALSEISEMAQAAIDRSSASSANLQLWADFRDDLILQPFIDERLRVEVLRRAKEGVADWAIDYLAFGADVGGTLLSQFGLGDKQAEGLVTALLNTAQAQEKFSGEARQWLIALASSPLRAMVPLQTKIDLSKTIGERWKSLEELWRLYCGEEARPDVTRAGPTESERKLLGGELRDMIKTQRVGSAVPNLQGIIELLGGLSSEEVEMIAELKHPLTWRSARSWLAGWSTLQRVDLHQRDLVRLVCSEEDLPEDFSTEQLTDESLREVIVGALTGGSADSDVHYRYLIESLLTHKPLDGRIARVVSAALKEGSGDPALALVLARRFGQSSRASALLFDQIGEDSQDELIALFGRSDEERFVTEAYQIYMKVLNSFDPLPQYDRALLRFLRSKRAERFKNRIATWYHGFLEASDIDKNLDLLIAQSSTPPEPEPVDDETVGTDHGWFAASLKPLLPDRLNSFLFEVDKSARPKRTEAGDRNQTNENNGEKADAIRHSTDDESDEPMT